MKNIYAVPSFDNKRIDEYREYSQYFDEPLNVYNEHYKNNFYVKLKFDFNEGGGTLEIPNCGGHVDCCPSSSKQLDWTLSALENISAQRTWATNWSFCGKDAYVSFVESIADSDSMLQVLCYMVNLPECNAVLMNTFKFGLSIKRICAYNASDYRMFEIDAAAHSHLNTLCHSEVGDPLEYLNMLRGILHSDEIMIDSSFRIDIAL